MNQNDPALSRRTLLQAAGAGGLVLTAAGRRARAAGTGLKLGFVSPRTGPLAGFGETDGYVLEVARKTLAAGIAVNGTTYTVDLLDRDTQSDPARAGQLAKALINDDGVDMMLTISTPEVVNPVADACEAAGVPCLGTVMPWEAWYFGRGAKPGQPSPFKWSFLFSFRHRAVRRGLHLAVVAAADQQESRGDVSERCRRQRDPRAPQAAAGKGRLHRDRSGRIRGRHQRLFGADRRVQEEPLRDFQHVPDPAGLRHVLAPGGAAGLYENGQDRADRQDRPVPVAGRGGRQPRLQLGQRPSTGIRTGRTARR